MNVFLNDIKAGLLTERTLGRDYTFLYDEEYLKSDWLFPFFSNMVPEGTNRKVICWYYKLDETAILGFLYVMAGKDIIGAVNLRRIENGEDCGVPSLLQEGFGTYCSNASKALLGRQIVSPILDFNIEDFRTHTPSGEPLRMISLSGVREKFPAFVESGRIRMAKHDEHYTHILKPAPWNDGLLDRKQVPTNEHVTMQMASQVYGILTASNGICFTPPKGRWFTLLFDILEDGTKLQMEDFASIVSKTSCARLRFCV